MQTFITEDFLLQSDVAQELYHTYAKPQPIFDYHCHLPPDEIAANKSYDNLSTIWLAGDHYKWRAMRSNGVKERFCTGDASDYEKFMAWAGTVPHTLRNPLYHWTHLELKRYFDIDVLLDESTADEVWEKANAKLATPEMSVAGILKNSRVAVICTTDDPVDSLEHHIAIGEMPEVNARVYPTFRPDKCMWVNRPAEWKAWIEKLEATSGVDCGSFNSYLDAIKKRHDFFHEQGCRLSDRGLEQCYAEDCTDTEAQAIFDKARSGGDVTAEETVKFSSYMLLFLGRLDAAGGWTKQLHLGAMRNNSSRLFNALGADTGFDSVGDYAQGVALSRYLDKLDSTDELPRTILYNLNARDNYLFATMIGNFQDGSVAGKMQFGSGWWFLDQKEGMEWQMNALSNLGLLSRFVGMLTDSRSFLSYTRHEYFRRILCNLIGKDVVNGELPHDMDLLGNMVTNICYGNAEGYFGLEAGKVE